MALVIIWSDRADESLEEITEFILETWNDEILSKFLKELNNTLNDISDYPEAFPPSQEMQGLRKCVINKQISLFYNINKTEIEIITLFDNRQDNIKLKF